MSIASEISRLQTSKADVKTQVNIDKDLINGGTAFVGSETVDDYDDKIKEMQEAYKKFIPIQTASGTEITLDNSSNDKALVNIGLDGNTEQFTTTGKNLFDGSQISATQAYQCSVSTSSGITTISSTASSGVAFARFLPTMTLSASTQYAVSFDVEGDYDHARIYDVTSTSYIDITTTITSGRASAVFTTNSNTSYQFMIYVQVGKTCKISKIQFEKNSSATPFEQYTGRNCFTKSIIPTRSKNSYWRKYNRYSREKFNKSKFTLWNISWNNHHL